MQTYSHLCPWRAWRETGIFQDEVNYFYVHCGSLNHIFIGHIQKGLLTIAPIAMTAPAPESKKKKLITVIGSSNTDMSVKTQKIPGPGETVLGGTFFMNAGGKGANQAVAASRVGGDVTFICKIGSDLFGREAKERFEHEGIDTSFVITDFDHPSGVALITVDDKGENCIVVAPGANAALSPADIEKSREAVHRASYILMQLEIPVNSIELVATLAYEKGIQIILNPAPYCELNDSIFQKISILTPNEKEAEMLTGIKVNDIESAEKAARLLHAKGTKTIIITMGKAGALLLHLDQVTIIPAPKVTALDTTAAGDVFNGALVTALAEGTDMYGAVAYACEAAAISVTRLGAQASAPYRHEIKNVY